MAVTLQAVRRRLADRLDDIGIHAVEAATGNSVTLAMLRNATPFASADLYDGRWVYVATGSSAGQQRLVQKGGYAPGTGALTIYPIWAQPAPGDEVELTALFPVITSATGTDRGPGEDASYRTIINRAASRLLVRDQVQIAITTADRYTLTAFNYWMTSADRLVSVLEPSPIPGRAPTDASWRGPRLVFPTGHPTLELGAPFLAVSGSMTLEILRPGNTLINGVESTTGATIDTDVLAPSLDDLVTVALEEAYAALAHRYVGRAEGTAFGALYEQQHALVMELAALDRIRLAQPAPAREAA